MISKSFTTGTLRKPIVNQFYPTCARNLGDGDPEWDEMKVLDEEDDFLRMKLADYDVTLHLLPDLWEIESYDRFSHIVMGDRVRKNAFDVVRALGAKEVWHASDYFGWLGGLSYPGCNFEEWMEYLGQEYGKPIQELSPADFWVTVSFAVKKTGNCT